MSESLKQYIDLYDGNRELIASKSPAAMNALRERARQVLEEKELPARGSDDYEATDLRAALAPDYGVNIARVDLSRGSQPTFRCEVPNLSTCLYYVFNDTFRPSSTARRTDTAVTVGTMSEIAASHPQLLEKYYGSVAHVEQPLVALNTLLAQDGVVIYIPRGVQAPKPIQLINVFDANARLMAVRRLLIVAEDDARAQILVCDHTKGDNRYLSLETVEIIAGRNATLDYYHMEESGEGTTRLSQLFVRQREGSNVLVNGITLTNGYTRNDYTIAVDGPHATTQLMGMAIATGEQHVDNHTLISHNAPQCTSREMFKNVLSDNAVGAFAGKILVQLDCPKIDAYQGNRNIVTSATARIFTKPQLEIYTDDVKCSHGSTVGQLDADALFYMQTRGISLSVAQKLLMQAFMVDVIDTVRLDSLRERLRHLVEVRLSGDDAFCDTCEIKTK